LILLIVDGGDAIQTANRKLSASHDVIEKEISGVPVLICINKVDVASRDHLDKILEETRKIFTAEEMLEISAKTGANVPNLLQKIAVRLNAPLSS